MCKAWKWAVVGVQREIRSRKVLNIQLGSLAFTPGGHWKPRKNSKQESVKVRFEPEIHSAV